ncbi:response regulator transcription factor [Cellvibrio japonicus]|uniref:DNA-binding response regulator n=1 Tax=Cellvibrio japonicus (strain Ueda107) TaxID=498211 RepID=B3PL83_CELJU|nr:response regulator transcription factor [Cellvibrio japonicus]ACE84755.1 DNA-binding response regulator [Cellvibrio japonicus Ueda107]QEI11542.1 response regulator transcription factor [Cellvibrio japonicus]QEI15116.1 response regulator transcription factor [Cellvibrio japonicus]QEI18696.1 response regulator transcription factor [Cellvibrio japonicus]
MTNLSTTSQQNVIDFLVVDDDQAFIQVLDRVLTKRGYTTGTAQDAHTALQLARQYHYHQAIVDLKLGSDSGLQLIRELKLCQPHMEIVILTGYSSISTAVEAIKSGATNYLCKPADADEILAAFKQSNPQVIQDITGYTPLSVERLEWEHIQKILQDHQGNISATARALGMHRRTLQRKLQKRPVKH